MRVTCTNINYYNGVQPADGTFSGTVSFIGDAASPGALIINYTTLAEALSFVSGTQYNISFTEVV